MLKSGTSTQFFMTSEARESVKSISSSRVSGEELGSSTTMSVLPTVSKLLSHASDYSHELAMLWEMYGPPPRSSKASAKKGRFEQVNDAVGYDSWDDEEEDREL